MKTKLIIIYTLLLSGCGLVNQDQIDKATDLCKNNGGIKYIEGMIRINVVDVTCNNGAIFKKVRNDN